MIDAVNTQLAVDDRRIFAAGFSNGAAFSTRLAHDIPNVIAAASPSGAGFAGGLSLVTGLSPAQRSVPLFLMLGDRDDRVTGPAGIEALPLDADILLSLPVNPFVVVTEAFRLRPFAMPDRFGAWRYVTSPRVLRL